MSLSTEILDYDNINHALRRIDTNAEAAETHGILVGMVCGAGTSVQDKWLEQILGPRDPNNLLERESEKTLNRLHKQTLTQVTDGNFELALLLPDDEEPLDHRISELGEWCQGFMMGLTLAGIGDVTKLPGEAGEIITDLLEITKAGYDPAEDEEVNESAYTEVVEYVRIGALVIYNELHNQDAEVSNKTLH